MQPFFIYNRAVVSLILKMSFSFHVAVYKTTLGIKMPLYYIINQNNTVHKSSRNVVFKRAFCLVFY